MNSQDERRASRHLQRAQELLGFGTQGPMGFGNDAELKALLQRKMREHGFGPHLLNFAIEMYNRDKPPDIDNWFQSDFPMLLGSALYPY